MTSAEARRVNEPRRPVGGNGARGRRQGAARAAGPRLIDLRADPSRLREVEGRAGHGAELAGRDARRVDRQHLVR